MICSSSWDSANMESSSTPTTWEWSPADIATGTTNLILVLDQAATVKGPYDDIRRPARYTASRDHSVRRRRQATTSQFSRPQGDRQVRIARTLNLHWGLPTSCGS